MRITFPRAIPIEPLSPGACEVLRSIRAELRQPLPTPSR